MTDPDVALLSGGQQVTVWERRIQGAANGTEIMLDLAGTISQANVVTTGEQVNPAVAALAGGGFVVVWEDYSNGNANADIRMRVYDAAGMASSILDFLVTAETAAPGQQFNPDVAGLLDGRFIVTWSTLTSSGGNSTDIESQIFDPRTSAQDWTGKTWGEQYVGTAFTDRLNGGGGNDTIWGEGGADTLIGGLGNDTLDGGAGIDWMYGTSGTDFYVTDERGDRVIETIAVSPNGDPALIIDTVRTTAPIYVLPANVENLEAGTTGAHALYGNALDNLLTGNAGADTLVGYAGIDLLDGRGGNDRLVGGTGGDVYVIDGPGDVIVEFAEPGVQDRVVVDFGTSYRLVNANLEALILGGTVVTGIGNAADNVIYVVDADASGGLLPGFSPSSVPGVVLYGQGGADTMMGGTGADILIGGAGADVLAGSFGLPGFLPPLADGKADQFRLLAATDSTPLAPDTVFGFFHSAADGFDRIDLRTIDANPALAGNQAFTFIGDAFFPGGGNGWLRLETTAPGTHLAEGDIDGNGSADFAIIIQSAATPAAGWFLL